MGASNGSGGAALTDDLIVCTRRRPAEVRACLETVMAQTRVPRCVVVVDSSGDDATVRVVDELATRWPAESSLSHVRSEPALAHQRNVGIDTTGNDVVHFVDDDTLLETGYCAAIVEVFAQDAAREIGGVGGYITNQPVHRFRRADVLLGLDSHHEGVVLASGRNVRLHGEPFGNVDVDWLPGCAMSYRRVVFEKERPDDTLGADRNGEDVDLSYRVRRHWRLVITPRARIRHLEVSWGRRAIADLVVVELVSRYERVAAGTGALSRRAFWVSAWGQLAWYGLKGIVTLSRERLSIAAATARGIRRIRELRRAGALRNAGTGGGGGIAWIRGRRTGGG